jgi:outer membrane lipoprotein-sorting protein
VLAHSSGIDLSSCLDAIAVEVDKTNVEMPSRGHIFLDIHSARHGLDLGDQSSQHRRKGLGPHTSIQSTVRRTIVVQAGELPAPKPVDGSKQLPLRLSIRGWIMLRKPILPNRVQRGEPSDDLLPIARCYKMAVVIESRGKTHLPLDYIMEVKENSPADFFHWRFTRGRATFSRMSILLLLQDIDSLLAEMEKRSAEIQTLTAHYERVEHLSLLEEDLQTTGILYFRKENRVLRWEESSSGAVQQIEKDRLIKIYPKLKEVEVRSLDERGHRLASLLGSPEISHSLKEDFELSLGATTEGTIGLKLLPRSEDLRKHVKEIDLTISTATYLVVGLSYTDGHGDRVAIVFRDHRTNEVFAESLFEMDLTFLEKSGYKIERH